MKKVFSFILIILSVFVFSNFFVDKAFADTIIRLKITTPTNTIYDQDITVAPCDSDKDGTTPEISTPYCAVIQSGIENDWNWDWAPGAFLNSLGDIAGFTTKDVDNNDVYHYWSWSLNGAEGTTGLNQYELQINDLILLNFIDPAPVEPEPVIVHHGSSGSIGGRGTYTPRTFDVAKAVDYLKSVQGSIGSFGDSPLYTDWTAIALGSLDKNTYDISDSQKNILEYYKSNNELSSLLTDNERHAIALLALGQNPYSFVDVNYIKAITDSFDGTQFGDKDLINDDIFALIPLYGASYTKDDEIIKKDIAFIISKQKNDGSWEGSVDMTGAAIQALKPFEEVADVAKSITKASEYLKSEQGSDGGFGSVSSTSWAMQAMSSLSESWDKNSATPSDYMATQQAEDGAASSASEMLENRIWATSYTIPAVLGKPWSEIMQNVPKPEIVKVENVIVADTNTKDILVVKEEIIKKIVTNKEVTLPEIKTDTVKPDVAKDALTATVINTNSENKTSNTLPLALGIFSGILLVFCVVRIKMK